jgi:hypothetical protein
MTSLIARIENAVNAASGGLVVQLSRRPALQLVEIARSLFRENHRLTTSNAQLHKQVSQLKRSLRQSETLRHQALRQLLACQLQTFNKPEASDRPNFQARVALSNQYKALVPSLYPYYQER